MICCPYCDEQDPIVAVVGSGMLKIGKEGEISSLAQKSAVEVECNHCQGHFQVQFEMRPAGIIIDLS